jgi:hypothetical protein
LSPSTGLIKLKLAPAVSEGHWLKLVTLAVIGLAHPVSKATTIITVTHRPD